MDPATLALFMQLMGMAGGGMGAAGAGAGARAGGGAGNGFTMGSMNPMAPSPYASPTRGGWEGSVGPANYGFRGKDFGAGVGPQGLGFNVGGFGGSAGLGGISFGSVGGDDETPSPMDIFKKLMKKQYPYVSQSEDELARTAIRETSRGAGAAGMGNSAVLQSIRDAAVRQANENKASARGQFLQQAFDVAGASQKAQAFNTMLQAAQGAGGQGGMGGMGSMAGAAGAGGSQMAEWLKMLLQQLGLGGGEGMAMAATPQGARWRAAGL